MQAEKITLAEIWKQETAGGEREAYQVEISRTHVHEKRSVGGKAELWMQGAMEMQREMRAERRPAGWPARSSPRRWRGGRSVYTGGEGGAVGK